MKDLESGDNVFLGKLPSIHISNVRQGFNFDPFGEIICVDQQISLITYYFGKGPTISRPHCANGQGLDRGLKTPLGWCIFGVNLWH